MNRLSFLLLILIAIIPMKGQKLDNKKPVYDTVHVYKCSTSIIHDGDSVYYKIDGRIVGKEDFEKVLKGIRQKRLCNPCFLKQLNLDGSLNSEGIFYNKCPGSDEKGELKTETRDSEHHVIFDSSCKEGKWLFYSKDGQLLETKYFDHGEELHSNSKIVQ